MKKTLSLLLVAALTTGVFAKVKNVIVLVPDGCDATIQTLARWYKGEDLQIDKMRRGAVKIHMANSIITGSAAAATAFSSGYKTTVRFLGIAPSEDNYTNLPGTEIKHEPYAPMATVLEAAKLKGKAVGLVSTSRITHATPAAFACHIHDRGMDNEIMEHMVYQNLDVAFGGGGRHLITKAEGGKRTDGENLKQVLLDRGYAYVETRDELLALEADKAWGMFASSHMDADMDRAEFNPTEPSIAEMTAKALEILSQDPDGFFIMIEGSQVDWAGHNNDPVYMTTDMIAFDEAVEVAVDFAKKNKNTLVLAFPDHNTGGPKIGHYYTSTHYTNTKIEDLVAPLKGMKITAGGVVDKMEDDYSIANIQSAVSEWWGLDITAEDAQDILDYAADVGMSYSLARILSERYTIVGWTTHGHNGEDVPVWAYGKGSGAFTKLLDNTDLAKKIARKMGCNLRRTTKDLFVEVSSRPDYELDETDPANPVVKIGDAQLPVSKDLVMVGGSTYQLNGIVVHAPMTGKTYIPKQALDIIYGDYIDDYDDDDDDDDDDD
ncbi:MAG: alkaline phosphatase, partial [Chitinivibrionales bacterium]|nr:alkaline phosphatase [Chitinivibrionales bacterium]